MLVRKVEAERVVILRDIVTLVVLQAEADALVFPTIFVVWARDEFIEHLLGFKVLRFVKRHSKLGW